MSDWRVLVAETVTGLIVADVLPSGLPKFSRKLCDKGSWSIDVEVTKRENQGLDFRAYSESRYSWVILFDDYAVQGGPCWTPQAKESNRTVTFTGTGLGGIFARRAVRNPTADPAQMASSTSDLTYSGLSLRGIARQLVADNLSQPGYGLPLDLPAAETGSESRTYAGADLAWLWDALTDLAKVDGGPEFDVAPYLVDDNHLRWELVIGTPLLGDQDTTAVWDYGGALADLDVDGNGAVAPASRVWEKGNGSGASAVIGYAANPDPIAGGYPGLDYIGSEHGQTSSLDELTSYAAADITEFASPTETWSGAVRIDGLNSRGQDVSPRLGTWALGDRPTFGVRNHFWIPDGDYRQRILAFSDATSQTVALELAEGHPVINPPGSGPMEQEVAALARRVARVERQ